MEFKDALKSSLHMTRVNQEIRRGERKEGYNHKVRVETHNDIPQRGLVKCSMVFSFIKKNALGGSSSINNVHILKYAYFKSGSEKRL